MPATRRVVVDLDGVVWLADEPIPGSADGLARLRAAGWHVAFFTNNSYAPHDDTVAKLARFGVEVAGRDVLSSAEAAARLVEPRSRALVLGGVGILEALAGRDVEAIPAASVGRDAPPRVDAVLVGLDLGLDLDRLAAATRAVAAGARLIGTNDDATYPTPAGPLPGGGAVLAAVAYASGASPVVAGKPYEPAAELVRERLGTVEFVIGDRPATDGAFARRLGARFGLVLSGVTPPQHGELDPEPDVEAPDVAALVSMLDA